jgi:hypothetical protein
MNSMEAPLQIPYIGEEEEEIKEGGRRREREERGGGRGRSCPPKNWILDHWSELLSHNILVE